MIGNRMKKPTAADFRFPQKKSFDIRKSDTKIDDLYSTKEDYEQQLNALREEINDLQDKMYAHHRYSVLAIFQAMDAAGKDSTVEHVFTGVNPMGVEVHSFKRPSDDELDHDFLWRTTLKLPARGHIGVFNRSYYEEVLICKVHEDIITKYQRLPAETTKDMKKLFKGRYESIRNFEEHIARNGTRVVKFFLNVSKKEQAARFLERIEDPAKNWKFNEADLNERDHWDAYQTAYEEAINETATEQAPWYVIPADDKKNMRLIVATILLDEMKELKLSWPDVGEEAKAGMERSKAKLAGE
jgi:PPK2 family polyphosphate:nucleotide phosphotransferase